MNGTTIHRLTLLAAALAAVATAAGCMVGPDFKQPDAPAVKGYTSQPLPEATTASKVAAGEAQRFISDSDIPGQWWVLFHSPQINSLIDQALEKNPSLQAAQASLRQAQENVYAEEGTLLPQADLNASSTRERVSGAALGAPRSLGPFTVHTASVNVSYGLDIWGGERRQVESLQAQADFQRFQLEASYLTLTSNVVLAAVQEASLRAQITATQDIAQLEADQLQVLRQQFELGGTSRAAVLAQEATLAQTRATLPPLEKQLAQQRNLLAVLAGRFPGDEPGETFDLAGLTLPQDLPLSLPSKLVEQRPDVRSAEETLHSASAQVGVATAAMLPQITLTGSWGRSAGQPSGLSSGANSIWSYAAGLTQPLFHGGELLHQKRAAVAAFDSAAAQYRNTVLSAFQNVADTLRALESDANALNAQVEAERSALDSLTLSQQQYQLGAITYTALLNAEQTYQQAHINLVQAQANRFSDTAALFQALGGGWWNRVDVTAEGTAPQDALTRVLDRSVRQ
jgi:NodT family efflux transporter outer membrane factor (OMF) lipoprotein